MNHKPGSVANLTVGPGVLPKAKLQHRLNLCRPPSVWKNHHWFFLCSLPAFNRRAADTLAWLCSWWGLPCRNCCQFRGRLLPCHFTLTQRLNEAPGGIFSVALSVPSGCWSPGVTRHHALRSPDFPPGVVRRTTAQRRSGSSFKTPYRRSICRF